MYTYILKGKPIPLSRPRFSKVGKVYDAQKLEKSTRQIELDYQHRKLHNQLNDAPLFTGPLKIDITFSFKIANSKRTPTRYPGDPHTFRPDLDNLVKFILDIGENIIFHNDCLFYQINAKKIYDTTGMTHIIITPLNSQSQP